MSCPIPNWAASKVLLPHTPMMRYVSLPAVMCMLACEPRPNCPTDPAVACPPGTSPIVYEGREACSDAEGWFHGPVIARFENGCTALRGQYQHGREIGAWTYGSMRQASRSSLANTSSSELTHPIRCPRLIAPLCRMESVGNARPPPSSAVCSPRGRRHPHTVGSQSPFHGPAAMANGRSGIATTPS